MFYKKMMAGILIAGTIAFSSAFSFAAADGKSNSPRGEPGSAVQKHFDQAEVQTRIKNALDSLVKDGTITREQENAIIKAFEAKRAQFEKEREELKKEGKLKDDDGTHNKKSFRKKHGVLKDLVDEGVITSEQADAIRKAIRDQHKE